MNKATETAPHATTVDEIIELLNNPYPTPPRVWLGKVPQQRNAYAAESDAFLAVGMTETARCFAVKRRYNCLKLGEYSF